ncbi:Jouberin [Geranomyces variabilis]|nr:Jouberin [Geranomyces variabilis]
MPKSRSNVDLTHEHPVRRSSSLHETRLLSDVAACTSNDSFIAPPPRKSKNSLRRSSSVTDIELHQHQEPARRLVALKYDNGAAASVGHLEKRSVGRKLKARRRSSTTSDESGGGGGGGGGEKHAAGPARRSAGGSRSHLSNIGSRADVAASRASALGGGGPSGKKSARARLSKSDSALSGPDTALLAKRRAPMPNLDENEDPDVVPPRRVLRHEQLAAAQQQQQQPTPKGGGMFSWKSVMSLSNLDLFGQKRPAAESKPYDHHQQQQHPTYGILRSAEQRDRQENADEEAASRVMPFTPQQLADYKDAVLSVEVHRSDRLIPDIKCQHPFVRVHIVDTLTGRYLQKLDPRRKVTTHNEPNDVNYILPVLTKTFNFADHRERTSPSWEEMLLFNEPFLPLISDRTMILFELLDLVTSRESLERTGTDGYYRIAWAFLKLMSSYNQPNTGRKARLQLYRYPPPDIAVYPEGPTQPHVYKVYQLRKHLKYPSTLYVTVAAHAMMSERSVTRRPEAPNEVEIGKETLEQLLAIYNAERRTGASRVAAQRGTESAKTSNSKLQQWMRRPGQRCKLPNKMMYRIAATNAFASAFSPDGDLLAVACVDPVANTNVIKIHAVRTGERVATLHGHRDLIYSLAWLDSDDRGLVSASSDGTARVWKANRSGQLSDRAALVLQHPTYVYCVSVHPAARDPRKIATACYDHKIRIWALDGHSGGAVILLQTLAGHERNVNCVLFDKDGTRLYSADGDGVIRVWSSHVEGAADGAYVCIKVLDMFRGTPISKLCLHPQNRRVLVHLASHVLHTLDVRLYRILTTYEGAPPSANRQQMSPLSSLANATTKRQVEFLGGTYIRPTYTPCGTMVLCGTEDGRALAWDTDSGHRVGTYGESTGSSGGDNASGINAGFNRAAPGWLDASRGRPVVDIAYHPTANIACFVPFGVGVPVELWSYDRDREDIAGAPAMTSHENIFANTLAFEEKLVSRKKEVAAMVDLVRQSMHNLAFVGGAAHGSDDVEHDHGVVEDGEVHNRRASESAELGGYVGEARRIADIERAHNLGASHGSILVALGETDEGNDRTQGVESAEAQREQDEERAQRRSKKKKKQQRVTYDPGDAGDIAAPKEPRKKDRQPPASEPPAS